jgi:phosphatidylinositol-3,4,5-trisphosphate 3-phosphatase/dual-specificity protein phosphatase PTEN
MMETRQILPISELDGFDKRRLPSPGFQVEVVILDHDAPIPVKKMAEGAAGQSGTARSEAPAPSTSHEQTTSQEATGSPSIAPISEARIFTGVEEHTKESENGQEPVQPEKVESQNGSAEDRATSQRDSSFNEIPESLSRHGESPRNNAAVAPSDFKAIADASAADASVFTFGDDDDDYESGEE